LEKVPKPCVATWPQGFIAYEINVRGILKYNPLEGVDLPTFKPKGRKTFVPKAVANKLIKECVDPSKKFLLFCGFHAGMRFKEMDYATVKCLDLDAERTGLIYIQNMPEKNFYIKDQEDRTVPMSDKFRAFLTNFLRGREPRSSSSNPRSWPQKSTGTATTLAAHSTHILKRRA
jgi:hypothetical protein